MRELITNVRALISIAPKGSQIVPLSLVLVLLFCLGCSFFFAWKGVNYWLPLVVAALLLIVVVLLWLLSAQRVDDASLPPVNISSSDGTHSTAISLHHGSLPALQDAETLERLLSILRHRKPLPEPDGLIDEDGQPIPRSQGEAQAKVEAANRQAQECLDDIRSLSEIPGDWNKLTQPGIDSEMATIEVGKFNETTEET